MAESPVSQPIPVPTRFEWDAGNRDKNELRHDVLPSECEEVFLEKPLLVDSDRAHSRGEARHFALGRTRTGRRLFVAFTIREDRIRVISARDMSRRERRIYDGEEDQA